MTTVDDLTITDPRIATAERTCDLSPTQYEGALTDGRVWYLRYRWGRLSLGAGADLDEAVVQEEVVRDLDSSGWAGYLSHAEVDALMPSLLDELLGTGA
jgi:hypothetical protein